MSSDWGLDETAFAGPEHLDADYIAGYEAKAQYDPAPDVAALLEAGVGSDSTVVDLGAGTGVFTRAIAPRVAGVIAVDVSPAMVDVLAERVATAGLTNVTTVRAGFTSYEHDGRPADAVFTRNALHQLPDFWKGIALARIHDALQPGGVLRLLDLVYDFDPADAPARLVEWMAGAVGDPARGYTAEEFAMHVRTEFGTYRWLLEPLLAHTGFDIDEVDFRAGIYATYTCHRR
jgi:SAM-dependent methyltransferase